MWSTLRTNKIILAHVNDIPDNLKKPDDLNSSFDSLRPEREPPERLDNFL